MNNSLIKDCWSVICEADTDLLRDTLLPLAHIDHCLAHFDLPLLSPLEVQSEITSDTPFSVEPSFKDLTDDILLALRRHIYARTKLAEVAHWAEKIMRFCEVRFSTLKPRAIKKCHTKENSQLHLLHLTSFLMDQAIETKSLRLLNTALKLVDLRWILDRNTISRNLAQKDDRFASGLFQFRMILTTEYALDRLGNGQVL